jgi:HK97 gp10 family phage protein
MSVDITVVYNNIPSVIRQLAVDPIAKHVAEYGQERAQTYAPKLTGHLTSSINVVIDAIIGGWVITVKTGDAVHRDYAHFQEYGTRKMAAQPFMNPAYVDMLQHLEIDAVNFGKRIESAAVGGGIFT